MRIGVQHENGITLYDVGRLENNMRTGKALAYDEAAKVIEGILNNFTKREREKIAMIAGIMLEADDEQKDCGKIAVPKQINVGGERAR